MQPSTAGKPAAVVAKIVEGRLSKFYEETVLEDQPYLIDDTVKVAKVLQRCDTHTHTHTHTHAHTHTRTVCLLDSCQPTSDFVRVFCTSFTNVRECSYVSAYGSGLRSSRVFVCLHVAVL